MPERDDLLLIFVKNPRLGAVKTRLAASIGAESALEIYLEMLQHTARIAERLPEVEKCVFYSDFIPEKDAFSAVFFQKNLQRGADLGARMEAGFRWGFERGYKRVVIIGSDCLQLTETTIAAGFERLRDSELCIGAAADGGYYLLGMNRPIFAVFRHRQWSHAQVFAEAVDTLEKNGVRYDCSLPVLRDIDTWEDLPEAYRARYPKLFL